MKKILSIVLLFAGSLLLAESPVPPKSVQMGENGLVTKQSFVDVNTTMNRLEKIVKKKGITFFIRIDHAQNSRNAGAKDVSDAQLMVFGKPSVGLKMMSVDPRVGLDLPLKMLAYIAEDGKVYVTYRDTAHYGKIYNLKSTKIHNKMSGILNQLSNVITKSPEDFKLFMSKNKSDKNSTK